MAKSRSSKRWLKEHHGDAWVKRARREGRRSRAVYKLEDIDRRDRLLRPGMRVVDLGAAPGGWSAYAAERVGPAGCVIALDLLAMEAIEGVTFIQGDFREDEVLGELEAALDGEPVDLVISDMAPNMSGISAVDQDRSSLLAELTVDFAVRNLRPGGDLLLKLFQGAGFESLLRDLRQRFGQVNMRKPAASRARSSEVYAVARNFRV